MNILPLKNIVFVIILFSKTPKDQNISKVLFISGLHQNRASLIILQIFTQMLSYALWIVPLKQLELLYL